MLFRSEGDGERGRGEEVGEDVEEEGGEGMDVGGGLYDRVSEEVKGASERRRTSSPCPSSSISNAFEIARTFMCGMTVE